jgi:hypothetical protein
MGLAAGGSFEPLEVLEVGAEAANGKPGGRVMPGGRVKGTDGAAGLAEDERA